MDAGTTITTVATALVTASIGGGLATLVLLPRQKKHLDASIEKTKVDTANSIIDQLQEEVASLRALIAEERALARREIDRLTAQVADRDAIIRQLTGRA